MKLAAFTAAALLAASAASAAEIGNTGLLLNTNAVAEYTVNAGDMSVVVTPEIGYTNWGMIFAASTDVVVYDNELVLMDAFGSLPVIDFSASYDLNGMATAYVKSSWDLDAMDMGEITLGVAFAF